MKVNQLKAGVILTYMTTFLSMVISFAYTPIMINILGQGEYGLYTLVNSVVANLAILSFGFGSAYIRFYSRYKVKNDKEGIAKLNGMFMSVFTVIAIITLTVGAFLVANVENIFKEGLTTDEIKTATILMGILVVNIAISFPASVFTSFVTANEKYIFLKVVNMIKVVFSPLMNLPILLLGYGSIGMVFTTLVVNLIADVLNIYYCFRKIGMKISFRNLNFSLLKEIWVFSSFIFLNIITDQINWNVDKTLLGMFKGSVAVAIYGVASHLNNMYLTISTSLSHVFIPRINNIVASDKENSMLTELFIKVGRIQFIILALVLEIYFFFGKYFISIWAGPDFSESFIVGAILLTCVTVPCIQNVGIEIQRAKNLHKFRTLVYFYIALANVVLSVPLCKYYGALGATVGTALSLVLGNGIIMNIYYHKRIGIDIIDFWKKILSFFPSFIIPTVYGIVANRFFVINNIFDFFIQISIMVILYSLSVFLFGMNKFEKNIVLAPVKKILGRKPI